jgi:hypothetical protein
LQCRFQRARLASQQQATLQVLLLVSTGGYHRT